MLLEGGDLQFQRPILVRIRYVSNSPVFKFLPALIAARAHEVADAKASTPDDEAVGVSRSDLKRDAADVMRASDIDKAMRL